MGIEIERKFLVRDDGWRIAADEGVACRQGYLASGEGATVRVRIMGKEAFLTIKGPSTGGLARPEFEYPIPVADAQALLDLCGNVVEKTRHRVLHGGLTWEVDLFAGDNTGLVLAEVELEAEAQAVELPEWAGPEVTGDVRYYNAYLARHPFILWGRAPGGSTTPWPRQ